MRVIFAGTPEFAAAALAELIQSNHEIVAVYTQPDKPKGRGLKLLPSPVKQLALEHHIPVYQPASLKGEAEQAQLKSLNADVMVVAAYGLLLPQAVLDIPGNGCINIHPSLLPRWRGAAPIQRTIHAGDEKTGVCIMKMDAGLDTGPVMLREEFDLTGSETTVTLHDILAKRGATLLIKALHLLANGEAVMTPQTQQGATYAEKIKKEEAIIDWNHTAAGIDRQIRAFNPWPMAYTHLRGERLRIGKARVQHAVNATTKQGVPGSIIAASERGIDVITGDNKLITILELQSPGGKMLPVADFYHAHQQDVEPGTCLI